MNRLASTITIHDIRADASFHGLTRLEEDHLLNERASAGREYAAIPECAQRTPCGLVRAPFDNKHRDNCKTSVLTDPFNEERELGDPVAGRNVVEKTHLSTDVE
jgi:hypothetical protein